MPRITGHRFAKDGIEYEIAIDFKDAALAQDRLEVDVVGRRRPQGERRWDEVALTLRVDFERNDLVVSHGDRELGRITLDRDLRGEFPDDQDIEVLNEAFEPAEGGTEAAGEAVAQTLEEAIQAIPVPDPLVGCLLKSGVSAVAGQIIRCANRTSGEETIPRRVRATLRCLGFSIGAILGVTARRTLWCMMTGGIS